MTFRLDEWSIVPGPASIRPPFQSTHLGATVEYAPEFVAEALLALPQTTLMTPAEPDWWSWTAGWSSQNELVRLSMTLFDTLPLLWGGFRLAGVASPRALLELYSHLHAALPATWLHNVDCELHTAESFGAAVRVV